MADKKVRVIAENGTHPINAVVTLTEAEAKAAVAAGWADDHPSAVKHAEANETPNDAPAYPGADYVRPSDAEAGTAAA